MPGRLANETLFNIYFVSNGEETLLRAFRLSDLRLTVSDKRMGAQRHLLLASRRSRDGYFRIGLGNRKPIEITVLHASSAMQPLAKVSEAADSPLALPRAGNISLTVYDMTGRWSPPWSTVISPPVGMT